MKLRTLSCALLVMPALGSPVLAASPSGAGPDDDRRARRLGARAPALANDPVTAAGGTQRSALRQYDFWQETEPLEFDARVRDAVNVDLDDDGWPELVRLSIAFGDPYGGTLSITRGGPYGPTGADCFVDLLPSPRCIRAVDFDGDGRRELLVAHLRPVPGAPGQFVRCVRLYARGSGGGGAFGFTLPAPSVDLAPGGELVLLSDADGDGVDDLVSAGTAHELYYQKGLGLVPGDPPLPRFDAQATSISALAAQTAGLPPGSVLGFGPANDLVAGDFDGDGSTDFAVAAGGALVGGLHVFYHRVEGWTRGGYGLNDGTTGAVTFTSLARGDFDGDGFDDLVATSPSRDLITLRNARASAQSAEAIGGGQLVPAISTGLGRASTRATAADLDRDGRDDLACHDGATGRVLVFYGGAPNVAPGAFSGLSAWSGAFDVRGRFIVALQAADVDDDGDLDLAAAFLQSASAAVLCNERRANLRKPTSMLRLFGAPGGGELACAFQPDDRELVEGPAAGLVPDVALDRFTFQVPVASGDRLRLRIRLHGLRAGIHVRLGLLDAASGHLRWVHGETVGMQSQEIVFVAPEATRFVSAAGELQAFVLARAGGQDFRLAIDQFSAEVLP